VFLVSLGVAVSFASSRDMSSRESKARKLCVGEAITLRDLIEVDPKVLVSNPSRLAKDEGFAKEVQMIWKAEIREFPYGQDHAFLKSTPLIYYCDEVDERHYDSINDEVAEFLKMPLYGNLIQNPTNAQESKVPGIVLFHTGAGPNDIFMRWKADALISSLPYNCSVLIADLVSDSDGESWDPKKYGPKRKIMMDKILKGKDGIWRRTILQQRIKAAIKALKGVHNVDPQRIGAMGWCLGGRAVSELARMNLNGVRCAVSFHGVVDNGGLDEAQLEENRETIAALGQRINELEVLLCNGAEDPFVSNDDLEACRNSLALVGVKTTLVNYENTLHGFTNPAQDLNPSPSFGYNEKAAKSSWEEGIKLFRQSLMGN